MTRYAALDWIYVDTNIPAPIVTKEYIAELKANGLWPLEGEKFDLTDDQYTLFNTITSKHIRNVEEYKNPGGSAFNTLSTISETLGSPVTLVAYLGTGRNAQVIRNRLTELPNFKIAPEFTNTPYEHHILTPSSNVVNYIGEDGKMHKVNFKHPGAGKQYITKKAIEDAIIGCDVFLLQGGIIDKYGLEYFEFALQKCIEHKKEICFTAPTNLPTTATHQEMLRKVIRDHASVYLSSVKETLPLCQLQPWDKSGLKTAGFVAELISQNKTSFHGETPSAFLTDEIRHGYMINCSSTIDRGLITNEQIPIWPLDETLVASPNGCGDASYAGYLIGLELGLSHRDSALLAMRFSAENIQVTEARTPNPRAILDSFGYGANPLPNPQGTIIEAFKAAQISPLAGRAHAA